MRIESSGDSPLASDDTDGSRIERLVRAAVPAHLVAYLRWLDPAEMASAAAAYDDLLSSRADQLRAGAEDFDDIWYGGRPARPDDYDRVRDLDAALAKRTEFLLCGACILVCQGNIGAGCELGERD